MNRGARAWRLLGHAGIVLAALSAGGVVERAFRLEAAPPGLSTRKSVGPAPSLPLRLVDVGGVGIPADPAGWGHDYSHNTHAFHDLIRIEAPYIDESAFAVVREDWKVYLDRMAAYGSNAVAVPLFLELIDFDRVGAGGAVYGADSPFRARHRVLRERFGALFHEAKKRGFQVFLRTDMITLTEPLARYLRGLPGGLDVTRTETWGVYREGLREVFASLPEVDGVVVRVGEAGPLYNRSGWPYWSEFEIGDHNSLRTMLRELLPAFEDAQKTLIFRSWSIGAGPLGTLHTDPETYERALGGIDSKSLIVSTKLQQGDFFSFLPWNRTFAVGTHRRIVELQARREFEGFGAFPNYVAAPYQDALRTILAANPHVVGTWLWTQDGGPLRSGPLSLYPLHGFWLWIDANVHATARLALEPDADIAAVTREWAAREVSDDPEVVEVVSGILLRSREAVERGFYIRPFAERRVMMGGIEAPPLLWIMEWDLVGGWSSVLSTVYRQVRPDVDAAIAEGFAAAETVASSRRALEGVAVRLRDRPGLYRSMHRSLFYEESLLTTLALYRRAFLSYYRWLDTGDAASLSGFEESAEAYRSASVAHATSYARDPDFPAFDFDGATAALHTAGRNVALAWAARGLLLMLVVPIVLGLPAVQRRTPSFPAKEVCRSVRDGVLSPIGLAACSSSALSGVLILIVVASALGVATVVSFHSWSLVGSSIVLLGVFMTTLAWAWRGVPRILPAAGLAPLLLVLLPCAAAMSVRGPLHFWFLFWTVPAFRAGFVALVVWLALRGGTALFAVGWRWTGRWSAAAGGLLAASGATVVVASLLLPDTGALLTALHSPLALLPLTFAVVHGILEYLGVPPGLAPYPALAGALLLVSGHLLVRGSRPTPSTVDDVRS